jgi:hypothetical protein
MASRPHSLLSRLDISAPGLNPGSLQQDSRTCSSCNDLLVNESSRSIILNGDPPFQYRRKVTDLEATASSGCVLCQQLLDRHKELGPKDASDSNCPSDCPWSSFGRDNSLLVFLIHSIKDDRYQDGGLRYLKVRGIRRAGERHALRERYHVWELIYDVATDDGN